MKELTFFEKKAVRLCDQPFFAPQYIFLHIIFVSLHDLLNFTTAYLTPSLCRKTAGAE